MFITYSVTPQNDRVPFHKMAATDRQARNFHLVFCTCAVTKEGSNHPCFHHKGGLGAPRFVLCLRLSPSQRWQLPWCVRCCLDELVLQLFYCSCLQLHLHHSYLLFVMFGCRLCVTMQNELHARHGRVKTVAVGRSEVYAHCKHCKYQTQNWVPSVWGVMNTIYHWFSHSLTVQRI